MIPPRIRPIVDEVAPIAAAFEGSGRRLFLVGGIVRDVLMGGQLDDPDIDLTTDATPDEIRSLIAPFARSVWSQGERFGTIGMTSGDHRYEITTHRGEAYVADSRKPEVVFSTELTEDLVRRDFTVNAMALEVTGGDPTLVDPFDGVGDIAARRLRTPRGPELAFSEDPLRMLRAARFIARFGFVPDDAIVTAATTMSERLSIVSAERIREELDKLMVVADPTAGLWFVCDTGLAAVFLPELPAMRVEQDPIHRHKDVLAHTIAVVAKTSPVLVLRLAALFHDVGKPRTREFGAGGVSFHHHEVVGARMTRERMRALRYSNEMVDAVSRLVYLHLRFHTYQMGWSDSAVRRFVRDAGSQLDELIELTRCDCTTRNQRKAAELARRMDELEARIAELAAAEELDAMRPDLDGAEVMAHLGIPPGRDVGDALRHLLELRVEQGPLGRDEALARLDSWWAERISDG